MKKIIFFYIARDLAFLICLSCGMFLKNSSCLRRLMDRQLALRTDVILDSAFDKFYIPLCKQVMLDGEYPSARRSSARMVLAVVRWAS